LYTIINAIKYIGAFEPIFKPSFIKIELIITAINAKSEDKDDIFKTFAQINQTIAPISVEIGIKTI